MRGGVLRRVRAVRVEETGGSPSVEAAILAVLFGLVIAFSIAGGRLVAAESAGDQAARAAARAASLERDATTAESEAHAGATRTLAEQDLDCDGLTVAVDTSQFSRPLGTPAAVRATVVCSVRWSDLGIPGAPGTRTVTATFTSPIDQIRERQ